MFQLTNVDEEAGCDEHQGEEGQEAVGRGLGLLDWRRHAAAAAAAAAVHVEVLAEAC